MKICVLGSGYIGSAYGRLMGAHVFSRKDIDYTDPSKALSLLVDYDICINATGFTGRPHIDECEVKQGETIQANLVLAANLSRICKDIGATFVHLSSGCIYQGSGNYAEEEAPAKDLSFYSLSKALAEKVVEGYILRLRMPFDGSGNPRCLLSKLEKYPRLINYENSLTYLPDLVAATQALLSNEAPQGVYNVVNSESTTHQEIARVMGWHKEFVPIEALGLATSRSNCTLSNAKLSEFYRMPSVHQRLNEVADARKLAA